MFFLCLVCSHSLSMCLSSSASRLIRTSLVITEMSADIRLRPWSRLSMPHLQLGPAADSLLRWAAQWSMPDSKLGSTKPRYEKARRFSATLSLQESGRPFDGVCLIPRNWSFAHDSITVQLSYNATLQHNFKNHTAFVYVQYYVRRIWRKNKNKQTKNFLLEINQILYHLSH